MAIMKTPSLLLSLLLLLLVGCGEESDSSSQNILHVGNSAEPSGLDPNVVTGVPEYRIVNALFEGLVSKDPTTLEPTPAAAERWEIAPDGMTYTFYLRKDARWSDGAAVTANDFIYSYTRTLHPEFGAQFAYLLYDIQGAEAFNTGKGKQEDLGLSAIDDFTLEVKLGRPNPFLLDLISHYVWFPVPEAVVEKHGGMLDIQSLWTKPKNFVGNGPFVLKTWKINDRITVAKSPTYWDEVKLDGIHFHAITSAETEERMFRAGQLHITAGLPLVKIPAYRDRKDPALVLHPLVGAYYYRFNTQKKPLDDVRVRRALAMAVDREDLVTRVTDGGETAAFFFTPPAHPDYKAPVKFSHNIVEAKRLLAEAGYPDGKGFPTFSILFNTSEAHREIAEAIQDMWKRNLGIEVTMMNMDWKAYLETIDNKDYDICRAGWVADLLDPKVFLELWTEGHSMNRTSWHRPAYDALIEQASQAPDLAGRLKHLAEAEGILMEEMPIMPLYHYSSKYLRSPRVTGYDPNVIEYHPWKQVDLLEKP